MSIHSFIHSCICVCMCMCLQRPICESQLSPSTMWVPGVELRSLEASLHADPSHLPWPYLFDSENLLPVQTASTIHMFILNSPELKHCILLTKEEMSE